MKTGAKLSTSSRIFHSDQTLTIRNITVADDNPLPPGLEDCKDLDVAEVEEIIRSKHWDEIFLMCSERPFGVRAIRMDANTDNLLSYLSNISLPYTLGIRFNSEEEYFLFRLKFAESIDAEEYKNHILGKK